MLAETLILILQLLNPVGVQYAQAIVEHSEEQRIDPLLVTAVMWRESRFKNDSCSAGSHGLMQIQLQGRSCEKTKAAALEQGLYDPNENIRRGIEAMSYWKGWCSSQHHDHHWLYHYSQGFGACPREKPQCVAAERKVHTEGRARVYVESILGIFGRLKNAQRRVEKDARRRGNMPTSSRGHSDQPNSHDLGVPGRSAEDGAPSCFS